jgi:hypothetical protein
MHEMRGHVACMKETIITQKNYVWKKIQGRFYIEDQDIDGYNAKMVL